MKKKKKIVFLLVASALFVGLVATVSAATGAILHKEQTKYYYDRQRTDGARHDSWHWNIYTIDGEVAYCIEPNVLEGVNYNEAVGKKQDYLIQLKKGCF